MATLRRTPSTTPAAIREVVVLTDEPDDSSLGVVMGKSITLDGRELLLPSGATIQAEVGDREALTVTVTFLASSVRFASA